MGLPPPQRPVGQPPALSHGKVGILQVLIQWPGHGKEHLTSSQASGGSPCLHRPSPHQLVLGSLPDPADVVHILELHSRVHCRARGGRCPREALPRGGRRPSSRLLSTGSRPTLSLEPGRGVREPARPHHTRPADSRTSSPNGHVEQCPDPIQSSPPQMSIECLLYTRHSARHWEQTV